MHSPCVGQMSLVGLVWFLGLTGCQGSAPSGEGPPAGEPHPGDADVGVSNVFELRVARHVDQPFSEADVDAVFAEAGRLLQTVQEECPDVAADVTFSREGAIETFDDTEAVITTEPDLDAVFALPGDIKIVQGMIGVCGIDLPQDVAIILGCATPGGSLVIVADAPPDVWAHEWGHVLGLRHRDDCARNLMHSYEMDTDAINARERVAFLMPGPQAAALRIRIETTSSSETAPFTFAMEESLETWLERTVRGRYLAGIPHHAAGACDTEAVSHLLDWYRAEAFENEQNNIIRLLGLAGDARAVDPLIQHALEPTGAGSGARFGALAEAFLALGRLVEHDPTGRALDFLTSGSNPQTWADRGVNWQFAGFAGPRLHRLLARLSILALGVSHSEVARSHLEGLREQTAAGTFADDLADQVDEALSRLEGKPVVSRLRAALPRQP